MLQALSLFPCTRETVQIPGPVGPLEARCGCPKEPAGVSAVICHPHPLFGGTMENKVVTTVARALEDLGLHTVRFNFRGVGASAGAYDEGHGETEDLLAVLRWLAERRPGDEVWLAGFSFGSYVAARGAVRWPVSQLISIAPPVARFDFSDSPPPECPWLVVQGDADEVVEPGAVFRWVEALPRPPELVVMKGASHFFHGRLVELREHLKGALAPAVALAG